jgi:methylated-DNA-[protein]-cysteine S-methyltransferase
MKNTDQDLYTDVMDSPIGRLEIVCSKDGLCSIHFLGAKKRSFKKQTSQKWIAETRKQLNEFFQLKRTLFSIPLDFRSGTAFQRKAWKALTQIPFGQTRSYGEQAQQMGLSRHYSRAVGGANNKNPIPIVIPCHRVIGTNGALVGFAGGLKMKQKLLEIEGNSVRIKAH